MVTDDLDCDAAATELLNRGRDEALAIAHLRSTLPAMRAIATALSLLADRRVGTPRRHRTIRVVYDDDGTRSGPRMSSRHRRSGCPAVLPTSSARSMERDDGDGRARASPARWQNRQPVHP